MAINDIVQAVADARVDARSLSDFVFRPASFIVTRRLAPPINTLQFYVNSLSLAVTEAQGKVAYIETTVQDAINNTAVEGGVLADTFVTMTVGIDGSVQRNLREFRADNLGTKDFGVVGDGVADDTEALRNYHNYCNLHNIPASYRGVDKLAIQADAKIVVNTDWDLCSVPLKLLNGHIDNPMGKPYTTTYIIKDELTPLTITSENTMLPDSCREGSLTPTKGIIETAGYVQIQDYSTQVPRRDALELTAYRQSFSITHGGVVSLPLSMDVNGTNVIVRHRADSKRGWLKVSNVCLVEDGSWNHLTLLSVQRNKVIIDSFSLEHLPSVNNENISGLISIVDCRLITLTNFSTKGLTNYPSEGTYVLSATGCAELTLNNIKATTGWSWMGTNFVNGLYVDKCSLNRIDGHASLHNVFVRDTVLSRNGLGVGWGGGVIKMSNITLIDCEAVEGRHDYGSWFYGDISIDGVSVYGGEKTLVLLNKGGCEVATLPFPKSISINNVTYLDPLSHGTTRNTIIHLSAANEQNLMLMPQTISISNIKAPPFKSLSVSINYGHMLGHSHNKSLLTIKDLSCDILYMYLSNSNDSGSTPVILHTQFQDFTTNETRISNSHPVSDFYINNVNTITVLNIPRVKTKDINTKVFINGGSLRNRNEPVASFGVTNSSIYHHVRYHNCTMTGPIDISDAYSLQGCILIGSSVITPDGVTPELMFTGWKKP